MRISDLYFTEHFNLVELCATQVGLPNWPVCQAYLDNMDCLCRYVLEPIRNMWKAPIKVNSGYRTPDVNVRVGGARHSQHLKGLAADITAGSKAFNRKLYSMIQESCIDYDQLILENGGEWIHVSWAIETRHQAFQKP